jgi:hypothetical protein
MKKLHIILVFFVFSFSIAAKEMNITGVRNISTNSLNSYYISNQSPLQPQRLIKLPTGSIVPDGWLRKQLELQREGLVGHLSEISAWLQRDENAWLKSGGKWGWEEVPYWLRGYAALSYIM